MARPINRLRSRVVRPMANQAGKSLVTGRRLTLWAASSYVNAFVIPTVRCVSPDPGPLQHGHLRCDSSGNPSPGAVFMPHTI